MERKGLGIRNQGVNLGSVADVLGQAAAPLCALGSACFLWPVGEEAKRTHLDVFTGSETNQELKNENSKLL